MSKKVIATPKAPGAIGPYSQGYVAGDFVYTAGQAGLDPQTGRAASDTIEGQAEQACKNLGAILEAGGASYTDVVKANVYLANISDFNAFNAVYAKYFTEKPARTCVAVKDLPMGLLCEVEVVAYKG
jgi:2-iminobutanoate/2-iminopropanoate deaminase